MYKKTEAISYGKKTGLPQRGGKGLKIEKFERQLFTGNPSFDWKMSAKINWKIAFILQRRLVKVILFLQLPGSPL